MRVKYKGPLEGVELEVNGETIAVAHNHSIDVPDDLGEALLAQTDWEVYRQSKKEGEG